MIEPPNGQANLFCIDVANAARAPHADYMFPLMRALNDTYFYGRWGSILVDFAKREEVPGELIDYLHKIRQAQTFEILDGFVCAILPKGPGTAKPIYDYLQRNAEVAKQFAIVRQSATNKSMMDAFRGVRNKLVFHYDRLDSHTRLVLPVMADYWDRDRDLHSLPMIRDAGMLSRYLCGDLFEDIGWHMLHGTYDANSYFASRPGKPSREGIYSAEYLQFFSNASADFCEYARTAIFAWISDNKLMQSKATIRMDGPSAYRMLCDEKQQ